MLGGFLSAVLVRLRFPLLVGLLALAIGNWSWLRNQFDRLTSQHATSDQPIADDIEYWCPMCPGVISHWPAKCPVCHMELILRKKGEATVLPDGVVARMQFSPYRVQLAGIKTSAVDFRPLAWEAKSSGRLESNEPGRIEIVVDVPESGIAAVRVGLEATLEADPYPGKSFIARVIETAPKSDPVSKSFRARLSVDDIRRELKPGVYATVRWNVPLSHVDYLARNERENDQDRAAIDLTLHSLSAFAQPIPGLAGLLEYGYSTALRKSGLTISIPVGSVIDNGRHKVVFIERMPGMFDGVEVTVGPRAGEFYPVIRGVRLGDRVVTAGAFLLDAETRLDPSVSNDYFGASSKPAPTVKEPPTPATSEDETLIAKQKICPVTDEPLGSMGKPMRLKVEGRTVFICCKACEKELRSNAGKYLAKLPSPGASP